MGFLRPGNLTHDEGVYLSQNIHYLATLTQKNGSTEFVLKLLARALLLSLQVLATFLLTLAAFTLASRTLALLALAAALALLAWKLVQAGALVGGIVWGKLYHPIYMKPLVFFGWWPFHSCVLCVAAALAGCLLGEYLRQTRLEPYRQLGSLQTYAGVDPTVVPGKMVLDAGLVGFSDLVGVDRGRGGCFMGGGHTYCVAPIVHGGRLLDGLAGAPRTGEYDFFAVGIDCCTCPNRDFKCGQWRSPTARGGVRSLDEEARPFFRLAVQDWEASYRKISGNPLFFQWVEDPKSMWLSLYTWATSAIVGASAVVTFAALALAIMLGKLLQYLVVHGYASHSSAPVAPAGFGHAWAWLLPELHKSGEEERRQLLGLPVAAAPWYGQPARLRTTGAAAPPVVTWIPS